MTRFMKPQYFDPEQQKALERALENLKIGDDEGRRIFIIALEYELAEFEDRVEEAAAPAAADETGSGPLIELGAAARQLQSQLGDLAENDAEKLMAQLTSEDRFARGYGREYLQALQAELERLSAAGGQLASEPDQNEPDLSDSKRGLIATLAEAYAECFESEPATVGSEAFFRLLSEIIRICNLDIKLDEILLHQLLAQRVAPDS